MADQPKGNHDEKEHRDADERGGNRRRGDRRAERAGPAASAAPTQSGADLSSRRIRPTPDNSWYPFRYVPDGRYDAHGFLDDLNTGSVRGGMRYEIYGDDDGSGDRTISLNRWFAGAGSRGEGHLMPPTPVHTIAPSTPCPRQISTRTTRFTMTSMRSTRGRLSSTSRDGIDTNQQRRHQSVLSWSIQPARWIDTDALGRSGGGNQLQQFGSSTTHNAATASRCGRWYTFMPRRSDATRPARRSWLRWWLTVDSVVPGQRRDHRYFPRSFRTEQE